MTGEPPRPRTDAPADFSDFFGGPTGPSVLPGTYTVRLSVDGQVHEQPVEVHIDPSLDVSFSELAEQHEMATVLRDLSSVANDALRYLDVLEAELADRKQSVEKLRREMPEDVAGSSRELSEGLTEIAERLTRPAGKTFWSQGPRLADHLSALMGNVDSNAFSAPTVAQQNFFAELQGECDHLFGELNQFFTETVPDLNQLLSEHGMPGLSVPDLLEWGSAEDDAQE